MAAGAVVTDRMAAMMDIGPKSEFARNVRGGLTGVVLLAGMAGSLASMFLFDGGWTLVVWLVSVGGMVALLGILEAAFDDWGRPPRRRRGDGDGGGGEIVFDGTSTRHFDANHSHGDSGGGDGGDGGGDGGGGGE